MPRLPIAAVLCGTALIGWSLGGVASTGRELAAVSTQVTTRHVVFEERDHGCPDHHDRRPEL
jgi:hypothetical protein